MRDRKIKGTENPGNFLTKHPKSGGDVREALPSLGMAYIESVPGALEAQRYEVKLTSASTKNETTSKKLRAVHPWKPMMPARVSTTMLPPRL